MIVLQPGQRALGRAAVALMPVGTAEAHLASFRDVLGEPGELGDQFGGVVGLDCGLRLFEPAADIAEVGHMRSVDDGDASSGTFDGRLAPFVRVETLAAEGEVRRAGEAAEFTGRVGEVDDGVGGREGSATGALVPR